MSCVSVNRQWYEYNVKAGHWFGDTGAYANLTGTFHSPLSMSSQAIFILPSLMIVKEQSYGIIPQTFGLGIQLSALMKTDEVEMSLLGLSIHSMKMILRNRKASSSLSRLHFFAGHPRSHAASINQGHQRQTQHNPYRSIWQSGDWNRPRKAVKRLSGAAHTTSIWSFVWPLHIARRWDTLSRFRCSICSGRSNKSIPVPGKTVGERSSGGQHQQSPISPHTHWTSRDTAGSQSIGPFQLLGHSQGAWLECIPSIADVLFWQLLISRHGCMSIFASENIQCISYPICKLNKTLVKRMKSTSQRTKWQAWVAVSHWHGKNFFTQYNSATVALSISLPLVCVSVTTTSTCHLLWRRKQRQPIHNLALDVGSLEGVKCW